jgi:hypothetical protein
MPKASTPTTRVMVNRAPVLTLWASVVAERLGFSRHEAMTFGKAVAGHTAQAKGRRLGIYQPSEKPEKRERQRGEEFWVEVCGCPVPAIQTDQGVRAVVGDKPISPASVESYLQRSFGPDLEPVRQAMESLARSFAPNELENHAYRLYEEFRPQIPPGKQGWGAKGQLDLNLIQSLGRDGSG